MSFNKKTWVDREAQYPVRRQLTKLSEGTDGQGRNVMTVDVTRAEGTITSQGDAFSAANMNDLENRIDAATVIDSSLSSTSQNALQNKEVNAAIVAALSKLAPTDLNGATAGSAHASGQYIIYGIPAAPKFGKTKAAISVGDTFNSGTGGNITDEDIATELTALNSALSNLLTYKDTSSNLLSLLSGGVHPIFVSQGTKIGQYTVPNNIRGFAMYDGLGHFSGTAMTYDGSILVCLCSATNAGWQSAVQYTP